MNFFKKVGSALVSGVKAAFVGITVGAINSAADVYNTARRHPYLATAAVGTLTAGLMAPVAGTTTIAADVLRTILYPTQAVIMAGTGLVMAKNTIKNTVNAYIELNHAKNEYVDARDAYNGLGNDDYLDGKIAEDKYDRFVEYTDGNYTDRASIYDVFAYLADKAWYGTAKEESQDEYSDEALDDGELDSLLLEQTQRTVTQNFDDDARLRADGYRQLDGSPIELGQTFEVKIKFDKGYDELPTSRLRSGKNFG